jgi:hypothetical protein
MLTDQEKKELKQKIQANEHEIFVVSMEEMEAILHSSPKWRFEHVQRAWQQIKAKAETGASYYASADDLRTLTKLVGDLGGFGTRVYVKAYGGKSHIILKGNPGLRKILTGTKYGIKNPKVVTMGLGRAGAIHAAKSGGILSVVLLSAYRVADYILTDEATLSQLVGSLATDVVKVGIATGASIGAASLVVGMGVTAAIGPIVAVIVVGVGVSMALSALDSHYGITDRVIAGLDEVANAADSRLEQLKDDALRYANEAAATVIDYTVETAKQIVINTAMHQLDKFLSTRPRAW